jgi:hypothetical protein
MARLPVFTEHNGELVRMHPSAPQTEDSLQELIARYPAVISGEDDDLLLVRREAAVPDTVDGMGRWSLDHLFVTRDAIPVLVEVKRAVDTRLRREVVGQLLDYAANGVSHWSTGSLERNFVATCEADGTDPETRMLDFLGGQADQAFWSQADANLAAGNIRMVVVADVIPPELGRVLEFMNDQMRATVLGVELTYFESEDGSRTLVPRVVGETEKAAVTKGRSRQRPTTISMDDWIAKNIAAKGPAVLTGAEAHLEVVRRAGATTEVASTQGSIVTTFKGADGLNIFPLFLNKDGRVSIGFGWIWRRDTLASVEAREKLLEDFRAAVGEMSTSNIKGHPAFPVDRLNNPDTLQKYSRVVQDYFNALRESRQIHANEESEAPATSTDPASAA